MLEAAMVVTWSSGFVGMRFSSDYAPVFLVILWRFIVLTLGLFPFVAREMRAAPWSVLIRQAGIGTLAMAGYLGGIAKGIELGVPAGVTALIADLLPLGTVFISTCFFRVRISWRVSVGLALGVFGMLIVSCDAVVLRHAPWWSYALPVAGMLSLAVATVWQQRSSCDHGYISPFGIIWVHGLVCCPVFLLLQGAHGRVMPIASAGFVASVAWTSIVATLGGCGLYWLCLRRSSSVRVTSALFLSPPLTFIWAWAMFREPLSWQMLVGTVISSIGVTIVVRRR
jgi:drug/metabolite transporter (DMT)-like permease